LRQVSTIPSLSTVRPGERKRWSSVRKVSSAHFPGDVPPDAVPLDADVSIAGGGEKVTAQTEVVADGAERPQEALRVLG
jgi:hypothetical protein